MSDGPPAGDARRRRVLAVAPFPPRLDGRHGGSRVVARLLASAAERNDVHLICLQGRGDPPVDARLRSLLGRAEQIPLPPRVRSSVHGRALELAGDYAGLLAGTPTWTRGLRFDPFRRRLAEIIHAWGPDIVHVDYAVMAQYLRDVPAGPGRVVVEHEVGVRAAADACARSAGLARVRAAAELRAWRRYEPRVLAQAHVVVAFTPEDAAALRRLGLSSVAVVPVGVDLRDPPLDPMGTPPPRLVFVGSFTHRPNVDAAVRLANDVLPRVRRQIPDVVLDVVGHAPPETVMRVAGPTVSVWPDVPDVTPFLERAAVFVAPLRLGGGARVKVLEALAAGKAVVASPRALEGISVPVGAVVPAETDDALARAIADLLERPERRRAVAEAGYRWARRHATWGESGAALQRVYDSVDGSERPR